MSMVKRLKDFLDSNGVACEVSLHRVESSRGASADRSVSGPLMRERCGDAVRVR
jgi:hypothetical protein